MAKKVRSSGNMDQEKKRKLIKVAENLIKEMFEYSQAGLGSVWEDKKKQDPLIIELSRIKAELKIAKDKSDSKTHEVERKVAFLKKCNEILLYIKT